MSPVARLTLFFNLVILAVVPSIIASEGGHHAFSETLDPKDLIPKKEQLTHLHFYFHDMLTGPNPTAIIVAQAPTTNNSATLFGDTIVFDNPLTVGTDKGSTLVGRAQGTYISSSQEEFGLLMLWNCLFLEGKYNGSTISIVGRNPVFSKVREMPIVGGSGVFRLAQGYVQVRTYAFDLKASSTILECDMYVLHY